MYHMHNEHKIRISSSVSTNLHPHSLPIQLQKNWCEQAIKYLKWHQGFGNYSSNIIVEKRTDRQMGGWLFCTMLYNVQTLRCMSHSSREREHSVTEWLTQAFCTLTFQMFQMQLPCGMTRVYLHKIFCCVAGWMCTDTPQLSGPTAGMLFASVSCAVS